MANKVTYIFELIDRYTKVGRKIAEVTTKMKKRFENVREATKKFNEKIRQSTKRVREFGRKVSDVGKELTAKLTAPLVAMGGVALAQSAKLEGLGVSFDVLIGDADRAKKTFQDLVQFTATTPFQLENVANAGKQLLSFGVSAEELVPTLRMLGELAAGTGKPLEEFSLIFGKILAKGRVQGEEMLQLAEKGISLQTILAKKFNVSGQVIADAMSKGQISFEIFNEALKDVTGEGGKFNGLTQRLSGTLGGLTSTLKDSTLLAFKELGDVLVKELDLKRFIADLIVGINKLTRSIGAFARANPTITKIIISFGLFLIVLGPIIAIVGQIIVGFGALALVAGLLGTTVAGLVLPFLGILAAIGLVITATVMLATRWDDVVAGFKLAIQDLPNFFKFIFDSVLNVFGTSIDDIGQMIDDFLDPIRLKVTDIIDGFMHRIGRIGDILGNIKDAATGFFNFGGDISTSSSSKTDVNVKLIAPEGTVESIKSETTGRTPGVNVGVNMAAAL